MSALRELGADELFIKPLAPNQDNTKNQIYVGSDLAQLARFSPQDPVARSGSSQKRGGRHGSIFHAGLNWLWLGPGFRPVQAPHTKFVVHPQYPEVRLSGFIKGCEDPPSWLLDRENDAAGAGRILLAAPAGDHVYALVLPAESASSGRFLELFEEATKEESTAAGAFGVATLPTEQPQVSTRERLLRRLAELSDKGWVEPVRREHGVVVPCVARNCIGYTLETHFGIEPNGRSQPDFEGWELKAHTVKNLANTSVAGSVTLLTPEPDGGAYVTEGIVPFVQRWGTGDASRMDFTGLHRVGGPVPRTGLQMVLTGYRSGDDFDADGDVRLVDETGRVAASWSFQKILGHWARKHAQTAYVAAARSAERDLAFSRTCWMGEGATFKNFLDACAKGAVRYDPGIKIMQLPGGGWGSKRRSQFRSLGRDLPALYAKFERASAS